MSLEAWFNEFWQTYPSDLSHKKKGSRTLALKYILTKTKPDEALQNKIMINLRELIRHCRKERQMFGKTDRWPFASTWINEERWNNLEDVESTSDLIDRAELSKCKCGKEAQIGKDCWDCYEGKTNNDNRRDMYLYDHLRSVGLGKRKDETKQEYNKRCREYCISKGSMGSLIGSGA